MTSLGDFADFPFPTLPMEKILQPAAKALAVIIIGIVTCTVVISAARGQTVETAKASLLAKISEKCDEMSVIHSECLGGNKKQCTRWINESSPWFYNEFGGEPIAVCPLAKDGSLFLRRTK